MVVLVMQRLRHWLNDEGGAMSGFLILVLPLLLMMVLGLNVVWQVANVKQTVHTGVYQAARFLSAQPPKEGDRGRWLRAAAVIIDEELRSNVVVTTSPETREEGRYRARFDRDNLRIEIQPRIPALADCEGPGEPLAFTVVASVPVDIDLLPELPVIGGLRRRYAPPTKALSARARGDGGD
jgi:Flp pilus assembly protein TadG